MELPFVPLVLAVTGHRELHPDDVPRLESQLREYFETLMARYPHTPLLLLSSLGPGADRLAARVATRIRGVGLVAVLPWPEGVCDDLRHRGGDRAEFDDQLRLASHRICLPLPDGVDANALCDSPALQSQCFENVGRYLTRHCQILLAIWDGREAEHSQTWRVIRWHLEGTQAPFAAELGHLDEPETGPLLHFPTRRDGDSVPLADTKPIERHPPKNEHGFEEIAGNLDRFNSDVARFTPRLGENLTTAKGYVFPPEEQEVLPGPLRFALERFAMADQLAVRWQRVSYWVLIAILGMILLTITLFECYAHVAPGRVSLLLGYPLLFGLGWLVVWRARRWRIYNRYLDFRALAEAMRVHLFWKRAGLRENTADFYLRSCRSQLDWIRAALRAWSVQSGEHDCRCACPTDPPAGAILRQVRARWMANQQEFFAENEKRDHHKAQVCHKWAWGFLCVSLAATIIQSTRLLWAYSHHDHHIGHDGLTHAFIMLIAMGGALAGLCHEYLEKGLFEKQARSYGWMASLYQTALNRFDPLVEKGEFAKAQSLIRELGREALAENADWVIYHREREPEMKGH